MSYSKNQIESVEKAKVRTEIINIVKKELKGSHNLRGLTLPNLNFNIEEAILNQFSTATIDCVEHDKKIYNRQLALPINNKLFFHNDDVFRFLRKTNNSYSFLWLDLCGAMQLRVKNYLTWLIQSDRLAKKCILTLTILKGREKRPSSIINYYENLEYYRSKGLIEDLKFFGKQVNRKITLLKEINYSSELQQAAGKASPMKVLIIKIENK